MILLVSSIFWIKVVEICDKERNIFAKFLTCLCGQVVSKSHLPILISTCLWMSANESPDMTSLVITKRGAEGGRDKSFHEIVEEKSSKDRQELLLLLNIMQEDGRPLLISSCIEHSIHPTFPTIIH